MKQCPKCSAELPDDARFCMQCGTQQEDVQAHVEGSGAAAQVGGVAAGGGSAAVGGDVGGDVIVGGQTDALSPADLRVAYLNHLISKVGQVPLSGIDPKAASNAQGKARLELRAVYTGLLTLTLERYGDTRDQERLATARMESRHLSALEQLDRHKRLVLLGDPGSGKSTFVNFVALCLAGEILGLEEANLERLTEPLPQDNEQDEGTKLQPWSHGALLPVHVVLRDFAARGLPPAGERATAKDLWDFIVDELYDAALGAYEKPLAQELLKEGGLLLLDGLDEVPEAELHREQIKQAVEDFAETFERCRILVTSRTYAYQLQAWRLPSFTETVLAPFGPEQIRRFVDRWYTHIAHLRGMHSDEAQGRAELLKRAIAASERLQTLAERPLLLTLMASLHAWRGGSLPEKREELYADTVDLLLDWWESPKVAHDAEGNVVVRQPSLVEWLRVEDRDKVRDLLNELAYDAHAAQADLVGTADVPEKELVYELMSLSRNPDVKPTRLIEYLSRRAGLLVPRGVGVYSFPNRIIQEYLAACYLTDHNYPDLVARLVREDPMRWREIILLAAAKAARGSLSAVWTLVDALCYQSPEESENGLRDTWGAYLAGQVVLRTVDISRISERHRIKIRRIQRWMVHILQEGQLPFCERVSVGNILARLGDPRFPAGALFLPDEPLMGFVEIPQGLFLMGNKGGDEEKPEHEVYLPIYKINRYPVTNAQYSLFINESGYEQEQYWTNEGWEWRDRGNVTQPLQWDNPDFNKPNQPVVGISWHEAVAYCRWLTEKLREMGVIGKNEIARLPTEAEWEKAGRDGFHTEQHLQRTQPWGDDAAKMREMIPDRQAEELGSVGLLPETATELDVVDMVGKVWQWTNSVWSDYPYDPEDGREDIFTEGPRVIRGGSWRSIVFHNRVTSRNSLNPEHRSEEVGFRVALAGVVPVSVSRVQTFFEFAGFDVEEANKDELVLLQREPYPHTKKMSPLYVRLVLDRALDLNESVKLCRAAERVYGEDLRDHTTVVVIDRPPQTGDLHQIFALRAQQGLGIVPLPTSLIDRACLEDREAEVLRDQLDLYTGRTDLYDIRTAVTDILSFFGRRSILADLQRRLTAGQSVFVFGVRKVGKSSLLGRLQEESSWPVALMDLEGYSEGGLNYVYREVLDSWRASLRSKLPGLPLPKPIDFGVSPARKARKFGEGVRNLLELLAERPRRPGLLLFLDELDTSFDHCDYIEFSAALRSIAEDPLCRGRFSILATGLDLNLNRMDQLEHGRNPFYEFFAEIPLGMLKKNDACAMITSVGGQMEIGYEESALDLLAEAGGGHPFLTRQLCSQAIQNLERPGTVDQARAVKAIEDYLGQPRNYLAESLWGIDAGGPPAMEAALLQSLATSQPQTEQDLIAAISPSEEKRSYRLALARLQDQSLIHNVEEGLEITIPLYRHWIRRYILDLSNEAPTEFTDEI